MTVIKLSTAIERRLAPAPPDGAKPMDADTRQLLHMAGLLGPRDRAALSQIIRRANEICDSDGEETALAVLDQIAAILSGRTADA